MVESNAGTVIEVEPRTRAVGRGRTDRIVARLVVAWIALVCVFFLWEAYRYAGLYAVLAEWQFDVFGRYLPILTYAALILLFGWPATLLLRRGRRIDRAGLVSTHGAAAGHLVGSRFRRALFAFAWGLAIAAAATLLWTLTLPRVGPSTRIVDVAPDTAAVAPPPPGPVTLRGEILFTRTAAYAQDLLLTKRGVRFAPIVAPGDPGRRLRYFVELPPGDYGPARMTPMRSMRTGVLMKNALPGSIVRLYRYAGYVVEPPVFTLYVSDRTIRWPYYVTAAQLAIAALLALLAALLQHRHVARHGRGDGEAASPPET